MKKALTFAAIAALGLSSSALADQAWDPDRDKIFELGSFILAPFGDGFIFQYEKQGDEVGFSFNGIHNEPENPGGGGGMWASDTRLRIFKDGIEVYHLGGFTSPGADWDFQGIQSDLPGFYAHGIGGQAWDGDGEPDWVMKDAPAGSVWTFHFTNGWDSDFSEVVEWKEARIIIHKAIPAPGALALLGIAGLLGTRRRR